MEGLISILTQRLCRSEAERDQAKVECTECRIELSQLREQNANLTQQNSQLLYENRRLNEDQSNGQTLVIGSSLLLDFDETHLTNTKIVSLGGAKVNNLNRELSEVKKIM